jgi:LacI family transcriptional regulator/LacI family repressor for deo operon, udp, cdd, tsx, nupC, and nupG
MKQLLDATSPPTAVFGGNNFITLGVLQAIHERGLQIPRDIAVVGFDDMIWATFLRPALTAIAQPGVEVGRKAAELLLERTADPARMPTHVQFATKLIVRASCGQQWKW